MNNGVTVRFGRPEDLDAIVNMHCVCFPEYYLTHLGRRIVRETYLQYFKDDRLLFVMAEKDGCPLGFIAGSFPGGNIDGDFWQRNFYAVISAMIWGLLRLDQVIWKGIGARLKRVMPAIKKKFGSRVTTGERKSECVADVTSWLVSIAVMPNERGSGIAKKMSDFFESAVIEHGAKRIMLCAYKTNMRAQAFYEKSGYMRISEGDLLYTYERKIA